MLDKAIVDVTIDDQNGQSLWLKQFGGSEQVNWNQFFPKFSRFFLLFFFCFVFFVFVFFVFVFCFFFLVVCVLKDSIELIYFFQFYGRSRTK